MKAPSRTRPGRMHRRAGRPTTPMRPFLLNRSRRARQLHDRPPVGFRFAATTVPDGRQGAVGEDAAALLVE